MLLLEDGSDAREVKRWKVSFMQLEYLSIPLKIEVWLALRKLTQFFSLLASLKDQFIRADLQV